MKAGKIVELGDVAEFVRGINFKPDDVVAVGTPGSVACMRTRNVQSELDCSDVWGVDERFVRREDQFLETGDILVSSANSWNLVGKCCWIPDLPWRATFGGFVSVLRPQRTKIEPRFLFRWFSSTHTQTTLRSFGQQTTNISNLNIDRCLKLSLPLPPLAEQRRIAEVLDRAEALRAKRRAALAQLDALTQAIFLDLFGDPIANPHGWPQEQLQTFFYFRTGKLDSNAAVSSGQFPFFTCSREDLRIDEVAFDCEALLLAGNNASADYSVKHYKGKFNAYQRTYVITLRNERNRYEYAQFVLEHRLLELKRISKGTNTKYLTMELLNRIRIPVPPESLQSEYASRVAAMEKLKTTHRASLAQLDALFAALQHRAFRGEL